MTPQDIFNIVATHLFRQGKPALSPDIGCSYRSSDGLSCAVGCLIPDEIYDMRMESNRVSSILRNFKLPGWMKENDDLLDALQISHDSPQVRQPDGSFHIPSLSRKLISIARYRNLSIEHIPQLQEFA